MRSGVLPPSRRLVLCGGLISVAAPGFARALTPPLRLRFEALRNGRRIGQQETTIELSEGDLVVSTIAEFRVKLGPLTLYRYRHEARERWRGDRFIELQTHTNQNGKMLQVSARAETDRVVIINAAGLSAAVSASVAPFSHWNRDAARRPLFNPQDGKLLRETVSGPTPGSVRLADGASLAVTTLRFRGDAEIDDDYDHDGVWSGLRGRLADGSSLEYRRAQG